MAESRPSQVAHVARPNTRRYLSNPTFSRVICMFRCRGTTVARRKQNDPSLEELSQRRSIDGAEQSSVADDNVPGSSLGANEE